MTKRMLNGASFKEAFLKDFEPGPRRPNPWFFEFFAVFFDVRHSSQFSSGNARKPGRQGPPTFGMIFGRGLPGRGFRRGITPSGSTTYIYHQINKYIYVENKHNCKGGKVIIQANTPRAPEGPGADPEVCTTKYRQKWHVVRIQMAGLQKSGHDIRNLI